ncbi:MAG: NYN domain-containing protein [Verrucomicrobiales bacterium]
MGATRLSVFFDGFNVYHSIKAVIDDDLAQGDSVKWLNLAALSESFFHQIEADGRKEISEVHYFSALASHKLEEDSEHVKRHQTYLRALKAVGVQCHLHRFKKRHRDCKHCGKPVKFHEEKETDVALAAQLIQVFAQDTADVAVLVSGDTDMAPAVRTVFERSSGVVRIPVQAKE